MKQKILNMALVIIMALAGVGGLTPAKAQGQAPQKSTTSDSEYLILFSIPQLQPGDAPAGVSPQEAEGYADRIIERQFEQIRPRLEGYVQAGQLSGLSLQPGRAGATVQVQDLAILAELGRLPGVQGIYPAAKSVECSGWVAKDLRQALENGGNRAPLAPPAGGAAFLGGGQGVENPETTDPVINVYHHAGGTSLGWVDIITTPDTPVSLRILRGGVVVGIGTGSSNSDGSYRFWPSSDSCSSLSEWELHDYDTVVVTAHGSTVSTLVTPLEAWMDPANNKVAGVTGPDQQVKIVLESALTDPCVWITTNQTVYNSNWWNGAFERTFDDFNRRADSTIFVQDRDGNSTYAHFHAYDIQTGVGWDNFVFHWKAGETVTASLTRGGVIKYSTNWTLPGGWDYYNIKIDPGDYIQPNDVIAVSSSIGAMSYTVAPLTIAIDPAGDLITGTTAADRLVQAHLYHPSEASCGAAGCVSTQANSSGAYSISTPLGLGDQVDVTAYDSEGNAQSGGITATPYLVADLIYNDVWIGYWQGSAPLTVTLMDSANVVKETVTGIIPSSGEGIGIGFSTGKMVPGDKINVTDGANTASMTVLSLAARLNSHTALLSGDSSNGHLKALLQDGGPGWLAWHEYCSETPVTNGSFSLGFSGAQIAARDKAFVSLSGADGGFTTSYANAFTIYIDRVSNFVSGWTEVAGSSVTVTAMRSGVTLDTQTGNSTSNEGRFGYHLAVGGAFQTGDVVQVTTNEGDSATLTIPDLTLNFDPANQRVYGVAPSGQSLHIWMQVWIARYGHWLWYNDWVMMTDDAGQYTVSTAGMYSSPCQQVVPGGLCTDTGVNYYFPGNEHEIYIQNVNHTNVSADAFEPDNNYSLASTYTAIQQHTFDTDVDEDWVKFNVPQADVTAGVTYHIQTFNLGPAMDTKLELYAADGSARLAANDNASDNTLASLIVWQPKSAGTYYVRVLPLDASKTWYCGAFYSLSILAVRRQVFLPLVRR